MKEFAKMSAEEALKELKTGLNGLTEKEASRRLEKHGFNELVEKKTVTPLKILLRQFTDLMVWVLSAAALISMIVGEMLNFWVIVFIIGFVITLGFFQEYKAEKAMEALKKIVQPTTKVIRNGKTRIKPTKEVVPGDVLALEMGDKVPADAKIIEIIGLKVDESALTGESLAVEKANGDLILAGTQIVHGKCKAVVIATGMRTSLGKIAGMIQEAEETTPLQIKIRQLAKTLAFIALIACIAILALAVLRTPAGEEILWGPILIVALALAVAAVPEGLPLTLTLTMSFGMHRMAKHKAIVRKMLAVETLGSTTVICTDKTGTLTKNEMTVERILANGKIIEVSGAGYEPRGEFSINGQKIEAKNNEELALLLKGAALCSNAILEEKKGKIEIIGDPTEVALVVAAAKADQWKDDLETENPRIEEIIFTSERKLMSTIHKTGKEKTAFAKGAPEILLQKCKYIQKDGKIVKLKKEEKEKILQTNESFADDALRVLGIAFKEITGPLTPENAEKDLVFLGLAGMIDPPREGVREAIALCRKAGIKTVMVTGDNEHTAIAIAKKIGLLEENNSRVITGEELDGISEREFEKIAGDIAIYARTLPEHKMRVIKALKKKGHIVAMTGDGVNDAPALKKADIGVAMGISGTDVTRESADLVLQDDNFATIVEAVRGGRAIYENIEKFTCYLISRNFTEVILIMLGIVLLGFKFLPLLALQILFINSFDEIMPSIALGLDPPTKGIMQKPPRNPKEKILKKRNLVLILSLAAFMATASFLVFLSANPVSSAENLARARTLTFATIISMILFIPFAFRSLEESILQTGILSNKLLILAIACVGTITLSVMYIPFFQAIFELVPLGLADWIVPLSVAFSAFVFIEILKNQVKHSKLAGEVQGFI